MSMALAILFIIMYGAMPVPLDNSIFVALFRYVKHKDQHCEKRLPLWMLVMGLTQGSQRGVVLSFMNRNSGINCLGRSHLPNSIRQR